MGVLSLTNISLGIPAPTSMTRDGREGSIAINVLHGLCDFEHSSSQFATTDKLVSELVLALTSPWLTWGAISRTFVKDASLN